MLPCFQQHVDFKYLQTMDEFNMNLTFFQTKKHVDDNIDILMGENNTFGKLIVMDDVSRLAHKSDDFANFLTVSRNLTLLVCAFFIPCTLKDLAGR